MYDCEMYFDLVRTKRDLDWSPRYSNAEMFRESYDWYLAHRDEVLGRYKHLPPPLAHEARRPARFRSDSFLPSIRA
jgi:hypothetical protein